MFVHVSAHVCACAYFLNLPALYLQHAIISTIHHLKTFYGYVPHPSVKAMYTFWAYGEWMWRVRNKGGWEWVSDGDCIYQYVRSVG